MTYDALNALQLTHVFLVVTTWIVGGLVMRGSGFRDWFDKLDLQGVPRHWAFYAVSWTLLYAGMIVVRIYAFTDPSNQGFRVGEYDFTVVTILLPIETLLNIAWAPVFFLNRMYAVGVALVALNALIVAVVAIIALIESQGLIAIILIFYFTFLCFACGFSIVTMRAALEHDSKKAEEERL